jgi:hypothetical protein
MSKETKDQGEIIVRREYYDSLVAKAAERDAMMAKAYVYALEAERERDALRDRLRWIPVEERLPEDNEYVLGAERHGCQCYTVWLYHHVLRELFVRAFSHWMPLPEPPEPPEGGEG